MKGEKNRQAETLRYANENVKYTPSTRIRRNESVTRITQAIALDRNEEPDDCGSTDEEGWSKESDASDRM